MNWVHLLFQNLRRPSSRALLFVTLAMLSMSLEHVARAQEAQWIWSPEHKKDSVPNAACHFRKTFTVDAPESGQIMIAADDEYEVFVNNHRVGAGESSRKLDRYNISDYLTRGSNLVAVKVSNRNGATAALVARVMVKHRGRGWVSYSTDSSWKTNLRPLPLWNLAIYNDSRWDDAQSFGPLGSTPPWDRAANVASNQQERHERFTIASEFQVQQILDHSRTGSLIAMTFNEFGQIIASREGGPLILITDSDRDNTPDQATVYCDKVKSCQGILALNGEVYVTGDGPDGAALYRLADKDQDGKLEQVRTLVKFKGELSEHGPHGVVLGPDGMIYVVVGNHTSPVKDYAADSPYRNFYEGDLIGPRYEDPGGHAAGVKAPGGVVLRTDIDGKVVQLVAGGLRNAYDLAFNRSGDLFVHDSDMESDEGTPWYRPTRVLHVTPGAEFGWRSGWAKWPDYFTDSLPAILDTGRGSPAGAVVYNHHMFPARFHDALFLADWSEGRILAVLLKQSGGSYTANSEVFLQGDPLNVTDLEVGPDGSLYFVTGGRGTSGGLYRITWRGTVPAAVRALGDGLNATIRQPQLQSAWCRQEIARLQTQFRDRWNWTLVGVARSPANPAHYRTRALDLMQLFGPLPTSELLVQLAKDTNEPVRAKAAELMGLHPSEATQRVLIELLEDGDRTVRRKACEALVRAGQTAPVEKLVNCLVSDDRFEAWAARRLLERTPLEQWQETVLGSDNHRLFIEGATALVIAHPNKRNALDVLDRAREMMGGFVSDRDFIDMLRVMQLAMHRGGITARDVPELRYVLSEEFPSGNPIMNRELARLLVYLQISDINDRYVAYLKSDAADVDKLHLALQLRFLKDGWSAEQKFEVLKFYEAAQTAEGGGSYKHYVMNVARDFAKLLEEDEGRLVLAQGADWPNAALGALYKLPEQLDGKLLQDIQRLDEKIATRNGDAEQRLKVGIIAVLARSGDEKSAAYLREIWERDPDRRQAIALGMAQVPGGENWEYLVRSLAILEGESAREVLIRLQSVDRRPTDPEQIRQVILRGLALKDKGGRDAVALLELWTGERLAAGDESWEKGLAAWQQWFSQKYPDRPRAELPVAAQDSKWKFDELLQYLTGSDAAKASAERGEAVFSKAQCIKCHRYGDRGESMGPDLTTVSKRFMKKEVLESVLYPSHVISDRYAAKTIITNSGRQYSGIVAAGSSDELVILQADGQKRTVDSEDIEQVAASKQSAMPEGLLNPLTLEEIADLFAYLGTPPRAVLTRRTPGDAAR